MCSDNSLLNHTLFVRLDMVVAALPMRLLNLGSRQRASEMVHKAMVVSWWLVIVISGGWSTSCSMTYVFFTDSESEVTARFVEAGHELLEAFC